MRPLVRPIAIIIIVSTVILLGWRLWPRPDPLAPLVPEVDATVRSALARGDVEAAVALADAHGHWASVRIYEQLRDALADEHGAAAADRRAQVLPSLSIWGEALARGFDLPEYRRDAAFWRQAGADTTAGLVIRWRDVRTALAAGDLPPDSVKVRLQDHAAAFRAAGDRFGTARTGYDLGNICLKLGQIDEARDRFAAVLADGRRWRLTAETCDALNSLALFALVADDSSGADYLAEALTLAHQSRLAARAGRALTVAAMHARREGGFARSMDLLEEAVSTCGELGEAWQGLPYLIYLMRFHAGLDDWRQVGELIPRAEALLREARFAAADPLMLQREEVRLRELALRRDIHEGRVDAALQRYPELLADARRQPFAEVTYIHDRQVRALLACGHPDAALDVLPAALEHAEANMRPEALSLLLARVESNLALGRLVEATEALDRFESLAATREGWAGALRVDALALRALLENRRGDPRAPATLRAGLARLAVELTTSDASSLAYVELQRNRLMLQALREIAGTDPEAAFGVELLWRRLPAWLGADGLPAGFANDPEALARELAARRQASLTPDVLHLLYAGSGDRVACWQVTGLTIACDTLAVTATDLRIQVDALLAELTTDPGHPSAPVPTSLSDLAEELAAVLLPVTVREGPRPRRLLVSGEHALAQMPFSVLDLEPGPGYTPLASDIDEVRIRGAADSPDVLVGSRGRCGPNAVVIADPDLPDRLRRRHPGLTDLAASSADVERVVGLMPEARVLAHGDATLRAVQNVWEEADLLYFASHSVRSSESPFRTFLPLSPEAGGSPLIEPYLDVGAIRAARLANCRLVVLASCASGAPYVSGRAWAPSLGDAFLDAGASAVLQTLWRVRDEDAARLPILYLRWWLGEGKDPEWAMARARRDVMRGPDGQFRHPFGWAAYVLELKGY